MMACTSPLFTTRSRPLRIALPSTVTCRFLTSNKAMRLISSLCFAVVVVGRLHAADLGVSGSLEIGILDAGRDRDLAGIRIVHEIDGTDGRERQIAQILRAGIDDLVRLAARRRADEIAAAQRMRLVAHPIFARPGEDEEHLVDDVVAVERERALAGWHHVNGAAEPGQADQRPDATPLDGEFLAMGAVHHGHVVNIDDRLVGHPTLPSRLTEISFCASTANSIGSCCSTSLTKPLTTRAVASSAESPRCRQ